jgi:hypothetical protein
MPVLLAVALWLADAGGPSCSAVAAIAAILLDLEHTCADRQCAELDAIIQAPSTTDEERAVARAVRRILHTPHPRDVPVLRALSRDWRVSSELRLLATMAGHFVHRATPAQREQLGRLAAASPRVFSPLEVRPGCDIAAAGGGP